MTLGLELGVGLGLPLGLGFGFECSPCQPVAEHSCAV